MGYAMRQISLLVTVDLIMPQKYENYLTQNSLFLTQNPQNYMNRKARKNLRPAGSAISAISAWKKLLRVKHSVCLPQMLRDVGSNQGLLPYFLGSDVASETVEIHT